MKLGNFSQIALLACCSAILPAQTMAAEACQSYGPQAPRDIDKLSGNNQHHFSLAPNYQSLNLCNIHFHTNAEHKAKDFSIHAVTSSDDGHGHSGQHDAGYKCNMSTSLSKQELKQPKVNYCKGIKPGDTVEVHWVHTSCNTTPGEGLGSCVSKTCSNPDLRVESQVFTVVNDASAMQFSDYAYQGNKVNGLNQARSIPNTTGAPVVFAGSTTGPKYTDQQCSPYQVTWSVRPQCAKLDINSLSDWCKDNVFKENHAHGVRKLVDNPTLLSKIH